jgi:glycosyltransferase involved in cell wall biosynthesis
MLSVVIIAKNEIDKIRECLESVQWANEIVVLDSGSTDGTVKICREFTDKVFETDWPGMGPQKNRALEKATGDWVLSIDADERVPSELRREIELAMASGQYQAYEIPRLSYYCGQRIRHSGWWPDYTPRLFRRGVGQFGKDLAHDGLKTQVPVGYLRSPIIHYSFDNFEDVLNKMNWFSTQGAKTLLEAGKSSSLLKAVGRGIWAFIRTYIFRAGFLDGRKGFMLAISNAEGTYYKYVKLTFLRETQSSKK